MSEIIAKGLGMKSEWKRVTISSVCDFIVDCVNKTATHVEYVTPYRMIRTPNINNGKVDLNNCRYVEKEIYEKWTRRSKVLRGDVLLTREAPMGRIGYIDFDNHVFLGQRIMQYRTNKTLLDSKFLLYTFLSSDLQNQFNMHNGSGTVVSHIRVADCSKFELNLPPLQTQKKIAHILSTLDDKIELNRKMNQTLEAMAQALFKSWFVDFEPFQEGEFVESELGMIPKGWENNTLASICRLQSGYAFKSAWWQNTGVKVIKIKNIDGSTVDTLDCQCVSQEMADKNANFKLKSGDCLIAMTGATVGKVGTIHTSGEEYLLNQRVGRFQPHENYDEYVKILVNSTKFFEHIQGQAQGSAQPNISAKDIEAVEIIKPTDEIMVIFSKLVHPMFQKTLSHQSEIDTLQKTRDTLLPKLLSGELDVSEIEL